MIFKTFSFIFCGKECLEAILPNVQTFFISLKPDFINLLPDFVKCGSIIFVVFYNAFYSYLTKNEVFH